MTFALYILIATLVAALSPPVASQQACRQGLVWREAYPGDVVCVTPNVRAQAAQDNAAATARRQPGGGAYGPNTCLPGFVWREAKPDDLVCVTPYVRARTAAENANAAANVATTQTAAAMPSQPAGGYRMTDWSGWGRAAGVEYRYRVGWDPANSGPGSTVDAIYQVRNSGAQRWWGAARSLDCAQNTLWGSTDVALAAGQTREVRVRAPNCGNAMYPNIRPNVVRAVRID
jgi:hypothetical protein